MYSSGKIPAEHAQGMVSRALYYAVKDTNRSPGHWGNEDPVAMSSDVMTPSVERGYRPRKTEKPKRITDEPEQEGRPGPPIYERVGTDVPELRPESALMGPPQVDDIRQAMDPTHRQVITEIMEQLEKPVGRTGQGGTSGRNRQINLAEISRKLGIPKSTLTHNVMPAIRRRLLELGIAPQEFGHELVKHAARAHCGDSLFVELYCALWRAMFELDRYASSAPGS